jgi:hypothetical protein
MSLKNFELISRFEYPQLAVFDRASESSGWCPDSDSAVTAPSISCGRPDSIHNVHKNEPDFINISSQICRETQFSA